MTERLLDETFAALFGHDGGHFASGAIQCAKRVLEYGDAFRKHLTQLEELAEELKNECKRLQELAGERLVSRNRSESGPNEKVQRPSSRDRKRAKG